MPQPHTPRANPITTLGVLADTHIPDRAAGLHPGILPLFKTAGVSRILHAGDICVQAVLDELGAVAPVTAVRGNRDLLLGGLRLIEWVTCAETPPGPAVTVALMHGHGGLLGYLLDKVQYIRVGYKLERYIPRLLTDSGAAQVVVFGHTHYPVLTRRGGKLLFNPGSASFGVRPKNLPSVGLLRIYPGGRAEGEIIYLKGWAITGRDWERV